MELQTLVPVISATGFAIQQLLQVLGDPLSSIVISTIKNGKRGDVAPDGTKMLPKGISDVDAKKALLGGTSIILGCAIALSLDSVRILQAVGLTSGWDWLITGLTISAGTEGANSVVKLMQYVKDAVKTKTPPSVSQNSPVPQAPAELLTDPVELSASDESIDIQSRMKEEGYEA
jgi:hypothetical protein